MPPMAWTVETTDEFSTWWQELSEEQQVDVTATVSLLKERGPHLPHPYSSDIRGSKHGQMRELRVQSKGDPIRVFYAFDERRVAILLIGGDKTGDDRFYKRMIPQADKLFDIHISELLEEKSRASKNDANEESKGAESRGKRQKKEKKT